MRNKIFAALFIVFSLTALSVTLMGIGTKLIFKNKAAAPPILTQRVLMVVYYAGHKTSSTFDYTAGSKTVLDGLNTASRFHAYKDSTTPQSANFQIVQTKVLQKTAPQLGTNCDQYLPQVQAGTWTTANWQATHCWGSGTANYNAMLTENGVCDLVNSNQIDEVWFYGFGNAGFWEANMTGPGAYDTNGPVVTGSTCNRPTHIMGLNYQRYADYALHSFGHRIEGTIKHFLPNDFAQYTIIAPNGNSSCGTIHNPPNSTRDCTTISCDWSDTAQTNSDCSNWNVNHTGQRISINCSAWDCGTGWTDQQSYVMWWMENMPTAWWSYIVTPRGAAINQSSAVTSPKAPIGARETATGGTTCTITGWAYDPDNSSASTTVIAYDKPYGLGGYYLTTVTANISRPDVNTAQKITGKHGFSISFKTFGQFTSTQTVFLYAADSAGGPMSALTNSPVNINCSPSNSTPAPTPGPTAAVTLTANGAKSVNVALGSSFTLVWTGKNVGRCDTGSSTPPGWGSYQPLPTNGSRVVVTGKNPTLLHAGAYTYGIQCTNLATGNMTTQDSVQVVVN